MPRSRRTCGTRKGTEGRTPRAATVQARQSPPGNYTLTCFSCYNPIMATTYDDKKIIYTMDRVTKRHGMKVVLKDIRLSY